MNDYPAEPPREKITGAARVYPGDGVAPLADLLRDLRAIGYRGMLSLELFNRDYWKQDPMHVARTGLDKMRALVRASAPVFSTRCSSRVMAASCVVPEDPEDDKLVAAALAGRVDALVTSDRHLLTLGSCGPVRVLGPAAFVRLWLEG